MHCIKFGWNCPVVLKKILSMCFCYFVIISLWKGRGSPLGIPFTQGCLMLSLVEIGPVVLEKKIFKFCQCTFSIFCKYLPLEKRHCSSLNKLESPSTKDSLCQVWLKLAQWFWRRRWKCEKFTDKWTDEGQAIKKVHLSFQPYVS